MIFDGCPFSGLHEAVGYESFRRPMGHRHLPASNLPMGGRSCPLVVVLRNFVHHRGYDLQPSVVPTSMVRRFAYGQIEESDCKYPRKMLLYQRHHPAHPAQRRHLGSKCKCAHKRIE